MQPKKIRGIFFISCDSKEHGSIELFSVEAFASHALYTKPIDLRDHSDLEIEVVPDSNKEDILSLATVDTGGDSFANLG